MQCEYENIVPVSKAAKSLNLSRETIYKKIITKEIPSKNYGGKNFICVSGEFPKEEFTTISQASKDLGITRPTILSMIKDGRLNHVFLGGVRMILIDKKYENYLKGKNNEVCHYR